jgi:hypothetical protein
MIAREVQMGGALGVIGSLWGCAEPLVTKTGTETAVDDPSTSTSLDTTTTPSTTDTGSETDLPLLSSASVAVMQGACTPLAELTGGPNDQLGAAVVAIGDVNVDGLDDLAVTLGPEVVVYSRDGELLANVPLESGWELVGIGGIEDLDGDGARELFLMRDSGAPLGSVGFQATLSSILGSQDLLEMLSLDERLAGVAILPDHSRLVAATPDSLVVLDSQDGTWLTDVPGPTGQGVYTISADTDAEGELARVSSTAVDAIELDGTSRWSRPVVSGASVVGILGDIDGDGVSEVAVGDGGAPAGAVHVLSGATGALVWSDTGAGPGYGAELVSVGDWDGDEVMELLAGGSGAVRVLDGRTGSVLVELVEELSGGESARFGASLDSLPDADSDGLRELVIGLPGAEGERGALAVLACHP